MTNKEIKEQIDRKTEQISLLNREIEELRKKFDGDILEDVRAKYMGTVIRRSATSVSKIFNIGFMMDGGTRCHCDLLTIYIPEDYDEQKPGADCMSIPTVYDDHDSFLVSRLEKDAVAQVEFDVALMTLHNYHKIVGCSSAEKLCELFPVESEDKED